MDLLPVLAGLSTAPLQELPGLPGLLSTLIVVAVVILVGRFLLNVALKIVIVAAVIVGLLWLIGALSVLPF